MDSQFQFMSVAEAEEALDLTGGRIRQLLLCGELLGHKLGGNAWAIPYLEIQRYKEAKDGPDPNG